VTTQCFQTVSAEIDSPVALKTARDAFFQYFEIFDWQNQNVVLTNWKTARSLSHRLV
jgi:hypothetical protein